jgi:hypothetical protein
MSEAAAKIRRLCRVLMVFCVIGMALISVSIPAAWIVLGRADTMVKLWHIPASVVFEAPGLPMRLISFALAGLLFGPALYAFAQLWLVLRQFSRGVLFDTSNVARLRRLGWAIMAAAVGEIVFNIGIPTLLTLASAPDRRWAIHNIADGDLVGLFAGGVVLLIARVLDAAREINDENAQII